MKVEHDTITNSSTKFAGPTEALSLAEQLWPQIEQHATGAIEREPILAHPLRQMVTCQNTLAGAMANRLSRKLQREELPRTLLEPILLELMDKNPKIVEAMATDILTCVERDPACSSPIEPLLYFKGFHAISTHRLAHELWQNDRRDLAYYLQSVSSEVFATDIHPAASIGRGILLDHATSFVVGETAVIEDHVSILHEVTLGGTGKDSGLRHPIVRSGVLIGAGAKILGRVEIGTCSKIGAGSVVLSDVPAHVTVAGVPASIVKDSCEANPADAMDQSID